MTHKLSVRYVVVLASLALLGVGCGGVSFNGNGLNQNTAASSGSELSQVPSCEINIPQLEITGNVNSFEFQSSGGVTFGYTASGASNGIGGSASLQISKASLDVSMQGLNPFNLQQLVGTEVTSSQTATNINATIDFSQFNVSPSYYGSTPLATVSENALVSGVKNIKSSYDSVGWIGRVIQIEASNAVVLNGGYVTGMMVGDTFTVYNVQHLWADNAHPCASGNTYYGSQLSPATPVANITVTQVDPSSNIGVASVVLTGTTPINLGAEVHPNVLAGKSRYLKKNVIVGTIGAQSFTLPGGGTFDFGTAINGQLRTAVDANGFVVQN
jgi:hypothetical protein